MTRHKLPDRSPAITTELITTSDAIQSRSASTSPETRSVRSSPHGAKAGSSMDRILDDACVALSLLLQHGVEPAALATSMGRLRDGKSPASIIGSLADLLAQEAAQ